MMKAWKDTCHALTDEYNPSRDRDSLGIISRRSTNCNPSKPQASSSQTTNMIHSANTHKILYPMRSFTDNPNLADTAPVKWSGLNPLDLVQQVVMMALDSPKLKSSIGRYEQSNPGRSFLHYLANESHEDIDVAAGQKRKRALFDDDYDNTSEECEIVLGSVFDDRRNFSTGVLESHFSPWRPSAVLEEWKSLHIHTIDRSQIDNKNSLIQLENLDCIVENFEQLLTIESQNNWCIPSYNRIQTLFSTNMSYLVKRGNVRLLLDQATQQMQALMEMVSSNAQSDVSPRVKFSKFVSYQDGSKKPIAKSNPTRIMHGIILPQLPLSEKAKKHIFGTYLTEWLCQPRNWANPYPDETLLQQMAIHFIHLGCIPGSIHGREVAEADAIEKISNWFVNTRTRQWRPAVEEAFDAKRPAMLLMEDSMRIFREKELRPLIGWDSNKLFAHLGNYSEPIATWDKKGSKTAAKKHDNIPSKTSRGNGTKDLGGNHENMNGHHSLFPQVQDALAATIDGFGLMVDDDTKDLALNHENMNGHHSLFPQVQDALTATLDGYGLMVDDDSMFPHEYLYNIKK